MSQNITVSNPKAFSAFLSTVCKLVPSAKFMFSPEGCEVMCMGEESVFRCFLKTDSAKATESLCFCMSDSSKFFRAISIVHAVEQSKSVDLKFDGSFLSKSGDAAFRLRTVRDEVVSKWVSDPMKTELKTIYEFLTTAKLVNRLVMASNIVSSDRAKVYIFANQGKMMGELDDKLNKLNDSVTLPITTSVAFTGNVEGITCLSFIKFKLFSLLDSDAILVKMTDKNCFLVESSATYDGSAVYMKLLVSTQRMN